jgi:APA family basic amino acid/polyamine antiporter
MAKAKKIKILKKELKLLDIYAIATGTTLSSGFFLLPGIAASQAGPAVILSYFLAAIPLIPAMFSIVELATAMPRAGGVYYFMDRALGPMFGTVGGIGTWLALILKVGFALVGMGAYISIFIPDVSITPIAVSLAIILGVINILGTRKTGGFQIILVSILLVILLGFEVGELNYINLDHFNGFFDAGFNSIISTAGLVYISYVGITKIASLSEEVEDPEKNLPRAVFLTLGTALLIYGLGTFVMVGVIPMEQLSGNLAPVATAAQIVFGDVGVIIVTIAALLAFVSVANAGTLSASRYPLAMSRDHIIPTVFRRIGKFGTPMYSIILTVTIIIILLVFLDPTGIAKLASAFQLLMFAFICVAVIVMRESKIASYDPGYKAPFYPYMQIFGVIASLYLITQMGAMAMVFSSSLIVASILWYWYYARKRVERQGAIYHIFERLGRERFEGLDSELRGILKEKGLRKGDPFDEIVLRSKVYELNDLVKFTEVVDEVAVWLDTILPLTQKQVVDRIMEGTRIGATPVTHGVALPHFRCDGIDHPEMVLVRSSKGIKIPIFNPLNHEEEAEEIVSAIFFLISPEKDPTQHLRILAQIAGRVDDDSFMTEWKSAKDEQELKECMLHDESFHSMFVNHMDKTNALIGKAFYEIELPENCLVALLRRDERIIVPKGKTIIEDGDRLTIIGDANSIKEIRTKYNS